MVIDSIGDFITKLKNAAVSGKETVSTQHSNLKEAIVTVLEREGYVKRVSKNPTKKSFSIDLSIVYVNNAPKLQGVERISHLSKRVYYKVGDIHSVKNGFGRLILSTSKGIMTDKEAVKEQVGGEPLFKIW